MNSYNPDTLIFVHIPKTAGSTFHMILNSRYPHSGIQNLFGSRYSEPEIHQFMIRPAETKKHIRLLKGHMPFGMHKHIPHPSQYIAMLRDPVERVISQYYYIKKNVHNPLHEKVEKGGMTIQDFVSSGVSIGMNNGQCRFLNGDLDEFPFGSKDQILLDSVMQHIEEHFVWLGITERFDESVLLLSKLMDWKIPPYYMRENVSKSRVRKSQVDQADINVIRSFNQFDLQLYQFAEGKLNRQIQEIEGFEQDVEQFSVRNRGIQRRWGWLPDKLKRFFI